VATPPRPGSLASRLGHVTTIIVVEDEPDIATFLAAFFRASGTEVIHTDPKSTTEVVELAVANRASCALVDLNLGGLSGFDVLEALHHDERLAAMPVVIVTADARATTRERAVGLGAAAFVPKPFNVKDLFATVRALVEGDPLLAESTDEATSADAEVRRGALRGGLLPAHVLQHRLSNAVAAARRSRVSVAFALLRVTVGGSGQPAVMAEVATVLAEALATAEILGATAPDELAVLFPADDADSAGSHLTAALGDKPMDLDLPAGRKVSVQCAAGIAASPAHATTGDELYMAADAALAEAVESGQVLATAR